MSKETNSKIEELQILQQQLQTILAQKQNIQIELQEIENALEELKNADDEVYKVFSGIMIRSEKKILSQDLEEKKKMIEMKIDSMEKQEKKLEKSVESISAEINKAMSTHN